MPAISVADEKKDVLLKTLTGIFEANLGNTKAFEQNIANVRREALKNGVTEDEFLWLKELKGQEFQKHFGGATLNPQLVARMKETDAFAKKNMGMAGRYKGFYPS